MTIVHESTTQTREADCPDGIKTPKSHQGKAKCPFAKRLHEAGYIYALYGALDGLSLSYSMIKYSFDLLCTNRDALSSDVMHEWMSTPGGLAASATEAITIIGFSLLANVFNDDDNNAFKRYIAILWPYCRDTMKALKNAYKGVRSTLQITGGIFEQNLNFLILPVGVTLGAISVLNRLWYRGMVTRRKEKMKLNADLLREIQLSEYPDELQCLQFKERLQYQAQSERIGGLLSQAYSGVVDGLYLYMGAMGLTALAPPVFVAMSICCVIFTLSCIAARVYEEHDFQRKLLASQAKVELALCGKEIETLFHRMQLLSNPQLVKSYDDLEQEQKLLLELLEEHLMEFSDKKKKLASLLTLSHTSAALSGLKDGLAAYGAIGSVLFAVATIHAMMLASVPPALLITAVAAGIACLIGFVAHSLHKNHVHRCKQNVSTSHHPKKLADLLSIIKADRKEVNELQPEEVKKAVTGSMVVDPSPQFFFQEWFEVIRSFFSGVAKGQKSIDYTLNTWQEPDEFGHYQDTPVMLGLAVGSAALYSTVLALRAHARGFGRASLDANLLVPGTSRGGQTLNVNDTMADYTLSTSLSHENESERFIDETVEDTSKSQEERTRNSKTPSPPVGQSQRRWFQFFSSIPRNHSADDVRTFQETTPSLYCDTTLDLR